MLGRKMAAGAMAAAMTLAVAACGGDSGSGGGGAAGGSASLNLGVIVPATTLAAENAGWANESPYMQAVYDTLIHLSPEAEPEPWLATDWTYNEDNTVLSMNLRTDVTFTDGEAFNAEVAAANLLAFKAGTSPNASYLANLEDAVAVDEDTVELRLSAPDPALLIYLGQNAGLMASPSAIGSQEAQTAPVGSGPYVLDTEQTVVGSKYVFTQNADYWAPDQQHYDDLTLTVLSDAQTQVNAISGGQVNGVNLLDQNSVPQVEAAGYGLVPHELDWSGLMLLDRAGTQSEPLGNVQVRQAINHAIDRDAMLEAVVGGRGTVTGQIFNPTTPAYDEALDDTYPFDPDRARELLAEAGYPDGFELEMPLVNIGGTTVYDLTKQYLGDVGITVNFTEVPISDAIATILAPKYPAAWFILQMDPSAWQAANFAITPNASFNPFKVEDETVAGLVETIQNGEEAEADAAAQELNQYMVDQAWFAPWYRLESNYAVDENTDVVQQADNAYPYLWNITPKA